MGHQETAKKTNGGNHVRRLTDHDDKAGTLNGDPGQEMSPINKLDWKKAEVLIDYFRLKYSIKHRESPITGKTPLTRFFEAEEMFHMMIAGPLGYIEEALKLQKYQMAVGVCFYNNLNVHADIKRRFELQCPEIPVAEIGNITIGDIIQRIKVLHSLLHSRDSSEGAEIISLPPGESVSGLFSQQTR